MPEENAKEELKRVLEQIGMTEEEFEAVRGGSLSTEEELDEEAEVTEGDVIRTQMAWELSVDRAFQNLLLAEG